MKTKLDEIDRQIIRYKRQGFSQTLIADALGLTKAQVSYRVKIMKERFGIVFNKENFSETDKTIIQLKNEGYGIKAIADVLNLTESTISNKISKFKKDYGMTFPPKTKVLTDLDEQIYQDFLNNLTGKEIADKYNLSQSAVSRIKHKLEESLSVEIPLQKIDQTDELIKKLQEEEHLNGTQIAKKIGISGSAVRKRREKIKRIENKQLANMIVNLIYTKHASIEQVKKMGECYGVDVEDVLNSLEEQER